MRGGCTETILDEAALRGIVCCTIHCCSKIRMMAFAVLSRMPSHILTKTTQQGECYMWTTIEMRSEPLKLSLC